MFQFMYMEGKMRRVRTMEVYLILMSLKCQINQGGQLLLQHDYYRSLVPDLSVKLGCG